MTPTAETALNQLLALYGPPGGLPPADRERLTACISLLRTRRKHDLLREGQTGQWAYFVLKGAIRAFYLQDGLEINTWFAFEQEVVASLRNLRDLPSRESLQTLEPCTLAAIHLPSLRELAPQSTAIYHFVFAILEEYACFLEDRLWQSQFLPARARYEALLAREPELFRRVSLTHIASYLGVSRETLSRLRST